MIQFIIFLNNKGIPAVNPINTPIPKMVSP